MRFEHLTLLVVAALLAGCTSTSKAYCKKKEECNYLFGKSLAECTEDKQKYLDGLNSGQRADCEKSANNCIDKQSCSDFTTCLTQITDCPGGTF